MSTGHTAIGKRVLSLVGVLAFVTRSKHTATDVSVAFFPILRLAWTAAVPHYSALGTLICRFFITNGTGMFWGWRYAGVDVVAHVWLATVEKDTLSNLDPTRQSNTLRSGKLANLL